MQKSDEAALARRLLAGDEAAFEPFLEHFRRKVFHHTILMCGNREDAEEVAQDSMLKVFGKLDQLHDPEQVRPWVFRIARNECLMKRRKSLFAPQRELSLEEFRPAREEGENGPRLEIADWSDVPGDALLREELRGRIGEAIRDLPETYKAVVLMRDVEELTTEETARVLDISTDLVKQRLHRGRLALRKHLDEYLKVAGRG
ncbi:MAG: RNA polymerase sigma factor [Acidobacteriia bacterium]|nr:RNA polymerase sigma factor [Terriglobia bacterium]